VPDAYQLERDLPTRTETDRKMTTDTDSKLSVLGRIRLGLRRMDGWAACSNGSKAHRLCRSKTTYGSTSTTVF
jgi:hypothetical protein